MIPEGGLICHMKRTTLFILISAALLILAACGNKKAEEAPAVKDAPAAETVKKEEPKSAEGSSAPAGEAAKEEEPEPAEEAAAQGISLAKRLYGSYSFHIGSGDLSEDEYYTMAVISFGDNLYAFCGQAIGGAGDSLECYSFWASEFIPDDASELRSFEADSASVTALSFSLMSNAGKYWGPGEKGTITLDPEGIVFEGFENNGTLVPENGGSRLFLKDERAEKAFSYLKDDSEKGDPALQGYWVSSGSDVSTYLYFENSNLYICRKDPSKEVFFSAGGCEFKDGKLKGTASTLGYGGMPDEWSGEYSADGDTLTLSIEGEALPQELENETVFRRIEEEDVHVTVMDEIRFDADSFGYFGDLSGAMEREYEDGFYGVWTSAVKDRDIAVSEAKKLNELKFDSYVCYSPEWENLNGDGYYCVTAGRFPDEDDAESSLETLKEAGFKDAYVKPSGKRKYITIDYTSFSGGAETEVYPDKIILKNVIYDLSRSWYPELEKSGEDHRADFIIDADTVFDETCETEFFGNYEQGDTPLSWYKKNQELMETDPDRYSSNGPALSGIFEVGITGNHIDRFFGSYWWD